MNIWETTFAKRQWGEYPPEELVRIVKRNENGLSEKGYCLELGCGPGANAKLLRAVYDDYYAIELSKSAINQLRDRISNIKAENIVNGDFTKLPWEANKFKFICDNFSMYANEMENICSTIKEVSRVLKPGGIFYSRVWGKNCYGIDERYKVSKHSYDNLAEGPCAGYGISTFFDIELIEETYGNHLAIKEIQKISREFYSSSYLKEESKFIEEYVIQATRK